MGNAGVGVVSSGESRFMHLVVLYGYHGADCDAGQLALTEQLFWCCFRRAWGSCSWAALHDSW